ncbi:hypothetical protein CANTEDRAFT_123667 [Yamadazyma tenuis ATCC 10573]|uniref:Galactose oxidase n=2 Tax=Candida tenuis TaxID=2315449 RepID=G3B6B2_CANTC|nr:uncharacterized protein CANTEDRAFT_123667 [Yamadazyma tenuis ATCC 10573]EGV63429.1 hypothetical protein CANTEDRAFT_123667 [Yamadazyma tenuis ATCC 10573]
MNVLSSNGQTNPQNHETNPPMSMASTYSNHMKSHRSNSGSMKSRPVSPSPQSPMMSPKPISLFRAENSKPMTFTADEISMDDGLEPKSPSEVDESKSEKHPSSPNDLFGNTFVKPGASLTSIFIFGGFILVDNGTSKAFEATNDFLRIDLVCDGDFVSTNMDPEAIIYKVKLEDPSNTPNASGYCASTLIEHNLEEEENCQWNTIVRPWSPGSIFDDEASSSTSMQTSNSRHPSKLVKITTPEEFYEKKALLIQGGCNHNNETFSDMYLFKFASRQWEKLDTFCFNHFDNNIQPYDDDPSENLTKDKQIDKPDLIEAELRASHHTALYYNKLGREFVFFVGGFTNHYLRNYDPKPYHSDKFDVSRLARVRTTTTNQEICRLLVYNTKTQTWGFYKYYYDIRKNVSQQSFELLQHLRELVNANMYHHGAGVSLDGKSITICHGLVTPVTEKKADFEALDSQFPGPSMILGAHIQITFPSL